MTNKIEVLANGIEARTDGSGMVAFDVQGLDENDVVIPGTHKTILLSAATVTAILAEPSGAAKKAAFSDAVKVADPTLSDAALENKVNANNEAATEAAAAASAFPLPMSVDAS